MTPREVATNFRDADLLLARRYSAVLFGVLAGLHAALAVALWAADAGRLPFRLQEWHANLAFIASVGLALIVGAIVFRGFGLVDRLLKPALGVVRLKSALSIYGVMSFALLVCLKAFLQDEAGQSQASASAVAMAGMAAALVIWALVVRRSALRLQPDPLA
jgi:glucan phosphoethanolaminetransferase (alkaline phosphatase superfamily)